MKPKLRASAPVDRTFSTLQDVLKFAMTFYSSQRALAKDLNLTESRFGKVLTGRDQFLTIERCLMLAKITGVHPSEILRLNGKAEAVKLIEGLYGANQPPQDPRTPLNINERSLLDRFNAMDPKA